MFYADKYFTAAIFFLILSVLVIIKNLASRKPIDFFWLCDLAPFLLFAGFLFHSYPFIRGVINVGLIPQFNTLILLFRKYVSEKRVISVILHLIPINLALFFIYNTKPPISSLFYSLVILFFVFVFTLVFTPKNNNINLIYYLQLDSKDRTFKLGLPYQKYLWIIYFWLIIVLPTFFIQYALYSFIR